MSHYLSQTLGQQMRMEQRLTPQLIQSMAVLQKPVAELEAYVAEALETNAALELDEPQPVVIAPEDGERVEGRSEQQKEQEDGFARLDRFARDFEPEWFDRGSAGVRRSAGGDESDAKMGAMANTAGREINLHEHLLDQWALVEVDEETRQTGVAIINSLEPDGYLRKPLSEIGEQLRPPPTSETIEKALKEIQRLEPTGVAARTAMECLLLQLDALPGDNTIERALIQHHLDDLVHNRLPVVAKATGYSIGEITEAMSAMRSRLYVHPGCLVGDRSVPPIRPDVIVEYAESGDGLTVRLARGNMPRLRLRDDIVALAKSKENGKEEREFAKKHVEEASALIDAINFRHSRLLQVSRAIAEKQRDFFDVGPAGLKVCRMSDLAKELSCDPSTISRTVADKYVQTPRGVLPMRYFFTGGTETEDGETVGWDHVKSRVREIVGAEDRKNPLNDVHIAALLKQDGIDISRRTVAKYRQQLEIPSARQRKTFE
ncbi:MAG: RNA polymerase factor sigma-54 [Phycisphaerales bacterium]|nr:RNA polymerase factor sigma-54 [Phycisphaerales bacterium]